MILQRLYESIVDTCDAELASLVIEPRLDWREDGGNVLASYSVHMPPRACAAAGAPGSAAGDTGIFLAPSATTGTLIATGRENRLVAAVAPWTMEAGPERGAGSSVLLVSCLAHRSPSVPRGLSNNDILATGDGAFWICDEDHDVARDMLDSAHDIPSNCEMLALHDHEMCHATVDLMVTAAIIPKWAAGALTTHPSV